MKNKKKVLQVVLVLIAVVCIVGIVAYFWRQYQNDKIYEEMQKMVKETADKEKEPEPEPEEPEDPGVEIPVDFESLQGINDEIYAWIQVEGTDINHPILQSATDDTYYLSHTAEKAEGYPGAIFTERYNNKDFTDFNTLVYGHNMLSGNMFQDLHNYSDPVFMAEHPYVVIYTPDKELRYRIFAAVVYDDRHIMLSYDFTDEQQRQLYLDSIYGVRNMSSVIDAEIPVSTEDRILTLSTCVSGNASERFLVEAVLESERPGKKAE